MSDYIRPRVPGACVFFRVALADRGSRVLVAEVDRLRVAVRATMEERPFRIDAWVALPDHLHAVWTLPEGDTGYSVRWSTIKARFTMSLRGTAGTRCRPGFSPAPSEEFPPAPEKIPDSYPVVQSGRFAGLKPGLRVGKRASRVGANPPSVVLVKLDRFVFFLSACWLAMLVVGWHPPYGQGEI